MVQGVSECTERLVGEIRELKAQNNKLQAENGTLRGRIYSTESALGVAQEKIESLRRESGALHDEVRLLRKRNAEAARRVEAETRRCDAIWTAHRGSSREQQASVAGRRIAELRNANRALNALLVRLGHRHGFDSEVAGELCSIAEGANDRLVDLLADDKESACPRKGDAEDECLGTDQSRKESGKEGQDEKDVFCRSVGDFEEEAMKE